MFVYTDQVKIRPSGTLFDRSDLHCFPDPFTKSRWNHRQLSQTLNTVNVSKQRKNVSVGTGRVECRLIRVI